MISHQGGCHCGKVRFQAEADPWMVFQCNCMRCRRLLGTVAVFVAFDDSANVQISGETREYVTKGESGLPVHHYFCPVCSTMVHVKADAYDMGGAGIVLGAFDDPHQFEPEWENYIELKLNWLRDNGCIKKSFEGQAGDEQLEWVMENYFAEDKYQS